MDRSLLTGVDLFSDLSEEQLDLLASKMTEVKRPVGSLLTEEGDISDKFFVILAGAVTVHRDGHHVADLLAGDFFGESGTAGTPARRNATVIATTPVRLGVIFGWDLRDMLDELPNLRPRVEQAIADRAPKGPATAGH
jgi:CRP-like cAMP-binding protein